MTLAGPFVLPDDLEIVRASELPSDVRGRLGCDAGDHALTRRGRRNGSKLIDDETAALLRRFVRPTPLAEAVIDYARAMDLDPEKTLEEAWPTLQRLIAARMLVRHGEAETQSLAAWLHVGTSLADFTVTQCIRLVEDSEIHAARGRRGRPCVVKICRPGAADHVARQWAREAEVLVRAACQRLPKLLGRGEHEGRPWLALTWAEGSDPTDLAHRHRHDRTRLAALCAAIASAYGDLHGTGVIHGDVHPGNLRVTDDLDVTILDMGLARMPTEAELAGAPRGAVASYWEPEFARAFLERSEWPATSYAGEQYSLGVLLDFLVAGEHALRLSFEQDALYRQIRDEPRMSFEERGVRSWPAVEAVFERAMAKSAGERFASVAELTTTLRSATSTRRAVQVPGAIAGTPFLDTCMPGGELFEAGFTTAPTASLNFGAAGIAYAMLRVAHARQDPYRMAVADLWLTRAERDLERAAAFYEEDEFRRENLGAVSPYHTASGVHAVRAMLSWAQGDPIGLDAAIDRYVYACESAAATSLDETLGSASTLLGAALLRQYQRSDKLDRFGDGVVQRIWDTANRLPDMLADREIGYLGVAHGWAGLIHAALAWSLVRGASVPAAVHRRLDELAALAEEHERGLRWRILPPAHPAATGLVPYMDGWCHGAAGHAMLWALAAWATDRRDAVDIAVRACETAWQGGESIGNLCCGLAGRAYAQLAAYRLTGDPELLDRAEHLSNRARHGDLLDRWPRSLVKGRPGVDVLAAELEEPARARMPFFELWVM